MYVTGSGDVVRNSTNAIRNGAVVSGGNAPFPLNYVPGGSYVMNLLNCMYLYAITLFDISWEDRQKSNAASGYGSRGTGGGFGGGGSGPSGGRPGGNKFSSMSDLKGNTSMQGGCASGGCGR